MRSTVFYERIQSQKQNARAEHARWRVAILTGILIGVAIVVMVQAILLAARLVSWCYGVAWQL